MKTKHFLCLMGGDILVGHRLAKICSLWEQVVSEVCFVMEFLRFLNMPTISIGSTFRTFFNLGGPRGTQEKNLQNSDTMNQ
jgi:hypothetical protein